MASPLPYAALVMGLDSQPLWVVATHPQQVRHGRRELPRHTQGAVPCTHSLLLARRQRSLLALDFMFSVVFSSDFMV